jgi:chaperonin GroES
LWRRSKFKHFNTAVEQVWFPCAHPDIGEDKTAGVILIPDTAKEKPSQGEITAVGPGGRDESVKLIPIDLKVGDRVLFGKWSGTEVKLDGRELLIMKESDIMGVLTDLPVATKKAA